MICTRYVAVEKFCHGKDVLEVGCGPAQGLGYLRHSAKSVVGGDYTHSLLSEARTYFGDRFPLLQLDAHHLSFASNSFDVVILFEAIYYLEKPKQFFEECKRVLRPGGKVFICTANRERPDFIPSPHSHHYPNSRELRDWLARNGFGQVEIFGAFPVEKSTGGKMLSLARKAATKFNLIPGSMKGKAILKRMIYGKLPVVAGEIDPTQSTVESLVPLDLSGPCRNFKVLYGFAQLG